MPIFTCFDKANCSQSNVNVFLFLKCESWPNSTSTNRSTRVKKHGSIGKQGNYCCFPLIWASWGSPKMKHSEIWWSPKVIPDWILPSTLIFSHWILWTPSFKCGCSSPLFLVVEWNNQWGNYLLKYNIITIITCHFPLSTAPDLSLSSKHYGTHYTVLLWSHCAGRREMPLDHSAHPSAVTPSAAGM